MTATPRVVVQAGRAKPFFSRHPWVFAGAIAELQGEPADGAEVDLVSHTGTFIARGLYNGQSKVRVRLYSWQPDQPLDGSFWRERLRAAWRLRQDLGLLDPEGACRLVNSEGDGLSGLTVDRYRDWLCVQFTSLAMAQRRELLADLLQELTGCVGIYLRTEKGVGQLEGLTISDGPLRGSMPPPLLEFQEAGLTLAIHLAQGQKTGYYLDQRDNRQVVAGLARGRRVLDAFCYSGGFGLRAAQAGAREVLGLDGSEAALALARHNAQRNALEQITFQRAEVFDELERLEKDQQRFGLVVLDPPKFARAKSGIDEALRGYRRLLSLAMRLLEPESFLVMCCCSGRITGEMIESLLAQVGVDQRREVQLIERRGPGADHPVMVSCPESHYLKCLISRVR
ncbi:MAG: class I SAM-dependent rRNA methyltransferase [Gemmataceae bacterium]